jgi:hypothetical protein
MPRTIEQQIQSTYFALRVGAAAMGFIFPSLLWGGGKVTGITLRDSISAYYWATPVQPCPCGKNLKIKAPATHGIFQGQLGGCGSPKLWPTLKSMT